METTQLRKRPLRSQPTRDRILEAARLIFGREGYDHATIRAIAAEAKINPAMVMRYYGSKDALFAAATEYGVDPNAFASVPRSRLGEALVRYVLDHWDSPSGGPPRRAVLLTSISNETVRAKYIDQMQNQYAAVLKQPAPTKRAQEAIALIRAQLIGLIMMRYILRVPSIMTMPRETLIREIGRTLQGYLRPALA